MAAPARRATLAEVAAAAGVSRGTASKALNANPARCDLSPATRERVRAAAAALGWRPPAGAVRSPVRTVGLVFAARAPDFRGIYEDVPAALAARLDALGYRLAFLPVPEPAAWDEQLRWRPLHAVLFMHPCDARLVERARRDGLPAVLVNAGTPPGAHAVAPDDRDGALRLARHLLAGGRRRLLLARSRVMDPHPSIEERRAGVAAAMAEAGLPFHELVYADRAGLAAGLAALAPDAVVGHCHLDALWSLEALRDLGRAVPAGCVLGSGDDHRVLTAAQPPITAVQVPAVELALAAAELAVDLLEGRAGPTAVQRRLAEPLVERASSRPG